MRADRSPWPPLLFAGTVIVLVAAVWAGVYDTTTPDPLTGWLLSAAGAVVTAVACRAAARSAGVPPELRRFWSGVALAVALIAGGLLADGLLRTVPGAGGAGPAAEIPIAIYAVGSVVLVWALIRLPGARRGPAALLATLLDAAIVMVTAGVYAWHFLIRAMLLDDPAVLTFWSGLSLALIGAVGVGAMVRVGLAWSGPIDHAALGLIGAGILAGIGTDSVVPLVYGPGAGATFLAAPVACLLWVLAAHRQARAARPRPAAAPPPAPRRERRFGLLPYLAIGAADVLLLTAGPKGTAEARTIIVASVVLTTLVLIRQAAALAENARLLARVDAGMRQARRAQRDLAHQATHDGLTGLPNRALLLDRADTAAAGGVQVSLALVDLDDFKAINDRLGHHVGDDLLRAVGGVLAGCVRRDDTVARLGGDEFAVLIHGSGAEAEAAAARIIAALERPIAVPRHDLLVGVSIGVAPADAGTPGNELMRRADLALYAAKDQGKGRYATHSAALDQRSRRDAQLGADLQHALATGTGLHVVYQPIVRLPEGTVAAVESLVRWEHPVEGWISPAVFIPIAERTGIIVKLGRWILRTACEQAAQWHRTDLPPIVTSVNVSARQLREPGFPAEIAALLAETGLPAARLTVEVTETAVFDSGPAVAALREVQALGVHIALDDFGTGHSSLGLLRSCPVDVLKVDKSFVDEITGTTEQAAIAASLIQITNAMRLIAVAEGVETAEQATVLHELGYRYAQGFHFARPLPGPEVAARVTGVAAVS